MESSQRKFSHTIFGRFTKQRSSTTPLCTELTQSKFPLACFICLLSLPFILVFLSSTHKDGSRILEPLETFVIPLQSKFCEGITLTDQSSTAQLFIFAQEPPLTEVISDNFNRSFVLAPMTYKNWYWSLFVKSHIMLYVCATPPLRFVVIRGDDQFALWRSDPITFDSANAFYDTTVHNNCTYKKKLADKSIIKYSFQYDLNITESNSYYFIFVNDNEVESNTVNFTAFLERRGYDTQGALDQCNADPSCTLDLDYDNEQIAIVKASATKLEKKKKKDQSTAGVYVSWSCRWRRSVYIAISSAIFVGAVLFTLICACFLRPRMKEMIDARFRGGRRSSYDVGTNSSPSKTNQAVQNESKGKAQYQALSSQEPDKV